MSYQFVTFKSLDGFNFYTKFLKYLTLRKAKCGVNKEEIAFFVYLDGVMVEVSGATYEEIKTLMGSYNNYGR